MVNAQRLAQAFISSCLVGTASCFVLVTPRGAAPQRRCHLFSPTGSPAPAVPTARGIGSNLRAKKKKSDTGRPSLDDVERLSRGQAAKKRGTGSRGVCHRLNESERKAYDLAKKQGYVVLRGTGYRRERKGSPLQNIFRQFCDAKAMPCTSVLTGQGADAVDEVEIDFSPLRASRGVMDSLSMQADAVAAELGALRVELDLGVEGAKEDGAAATAAAAAAEVLPDGTAAGEGSEIVEEEEEEEEGWTGDPNNRPIWKFPVVSRVYRCDSRKQAKDVAMALSSVR